MCEGFSDAGEKGDANAVQTFVEGHGGFSSRFCQALNLGVGVVGGENELSVMGGKPLQAEGEGFALGVVAFVERRLAICEAREKFLIEKMAVAGASAQVHEDLVTGHGVGPWTKVGGGLEVAPKRDDDLLHDLIGFVAGWQHGANEGAQGRFVDRVESEKLGVFWGGLIFGHGWHVEWDAAPAFICRKKFTRFRDAVPDFLLTDAALDFLRVETGDGDDFVAAFLSGQQGG